MQDSKVDAEKRLQEEKGRLEEDVETLKQQLGQKEARVEELMSRLVSGDGRMVFMVLCVFLHCCQCVDGVHTKERDG